VTVEDEAASPVPLPEETRPAVDAHSLPGMRPAGVEVSFLSPPVSRSAKYQRVWIWQETNDCLWNMAREHYGDPFLWPRIYEANRDLIRDPNVIFPKQQIVIPPLETAQVYEPPMLPPPPPPVEEPVAVEPAPAPPPPPEPEKPAEPKADGELWKERRQFTQW